MSQTPTRPRPRPRAPARTLWEEGRTPGNRVVTLSVLAAVGLAAVNIALTEALSLFYDLTFVVICLVGALAVRPRDFFRVGVLAPLLMLTTVTLLALVDTAYVAEETDGLVQAVVSGLAHHAGALLAGHALALAALGLRQVAVRNSGRLRTSA